MPEENEAAAAVRSSSDMLSLESLPHNNILCVAIALLCHVRAVKDD